MDDWRSLLARQRGRLEWERSCAPEELAEAERSLEVDLPSDLKALLGEADGFYDTASHYAYCWDLRTIVANNALHWRHGDHRLDPSLLAFGADGSGTGAFCLSLQGEEAVYYWNWIDSQRRQIAPDLPSFWSGWLDGAITV